MDYIQPVNFACDLAEGLAVTSLGNVGIGKLNPSAKLDIEPADSVTTALRIKAATGQDFALIDLRNTLNNPNFILQNDKLTIGTTVYDYTQSNGTNFKGLQINYVGPGYTEGLVLSDVGLGGATLLRFDGYSSLHVKDLYGAYKTVVANAIGNPSDGNTLYNGYNMWRLNSNLLIGGESFPNSTLNVQGSLATGYTSTASSLTLGLSHYSANVTASGQTITLPSAVDIAGRTYVIKLTASGSVRLPPLHHKQLMAPVPSFSAPWKYVTVQSDNANWIIIGNN